MSMGLYLLWWGLCVSIGMLARAIYQRQRQIEDLARRRAQEDLGMERWHQQDLAAWDAEFTRLVGKEPFPCPPGWNYDQLRNLESRGMLNNPYQQLLAPGLQNAFQQQQQLGMGIGGLMAQQAQQGVFDLDKAHAELRQQEIIARMLGRGHH